MSTKLSKFAQKRKLVTTDTTLDAIRAYFIQPDGIEVKLTPKQVEIKDRLQQVWTWLCKGESNEGIVALQRETNNIKRRQSYEDIRNATALFGDVRKSSKEGMRYILHEYAMKCYQLAATTADIKEMNKSVANMIKLLGLDKDDNLQFNPEDIQPPQVLIGFIPEQLKTDLPENWEELVAQMQEPKKKNNLNSASFDDAEIIE